MTAAALARVTARPDATLRDAMQVIEGAGLRVAILAEPDGTVVGLLTDGDARRALLGGASLDEPALAFSTPHPHTAPAGTGRAQVLDLMRALHVAELPEIDDQGRLTGLHTLHDVAGPPDLPHTAVIMAGGKGTRLGALTSETPKPLMDVAGRSILEWIVLNLVGGGVRHVVVSVNHLADQIEDHLGDGSGLGCTVSYLREDPDLPLGTAGSLALLGDRAGGNDNPLLVMNGDLMVRFDPAELLRTHERLGAAVTIATRPYQHQVAYGVVDTDEDSLVTAVREKPTVSLTVNAGVYAVSPDALDLVPAGRASTMPDLVDQCLGEGRKVASWRLTSEWIDVGTPTDLARAKGSL